MERADWAVPSSFVARYGQEIAKHAPGAILDLACGTGRNALYLGSLGCSVICADNDQNRLETLLAQDRLLRSSRNETESPNRTHLVALNIDFKSVPWMFPRSSLGGIVNVHFFLPNVLHDCVRAIKPGGYFLIETIGGQGENYMELPPAGLVKAAIRSRFDIRVYREKKVGPPHVDAVTVKLFAKKL